MDVSCSYSSCHLRRPQCLSVESGNTKTKAAEKELLKPAVFRLYWLAAGVSKVKRDQS